jgi:hypothetical protein
MQIEFDGICEALMEQARKGHYNAAQLLLRLAGLGAVAAEPRETTEEEEAKSFLLDLVEELLAPKANREQTDASGRNAAGPDGNEEETG